MFKWNTDKAGHDIFDIPSQLFFNHSLLSNTYPLMHPQSHLVVIADCNSYLFVVNNVGLGDEYPQLLHECQADVSCSNEFV